MKSCYKVILWMRLILTWRVDVWMRNFFRTQWALFISEKDGARSLLRSTFDLCKFRCYKARKRSSFFFFFFFYFVLNNTDIHLSRPPDISQSSALWYFFYQLLMHECSWTRSNNLLSILRFNRDKLSQQITLTRTLIIARMTRMFFSFCRGE